MIKRMVLEAIFKLNLSLRVIVNYVKKCVHEIEDIFGTFKKMSY